MNALEDGDKVCSCAAAGIEDADAGRGEAERLVKFGAEEMIDALDHVVDDLAWRVPDAQLLAELWVEGFKEGLVEVVDSIFFSERCEEDGLDAVERVASEVEYFGQRGGVEAAGFGDGIEELPENGDA